MITMLKVRRTTAVIGCAAALSLGGLAAAAPASAAARTAIAPTAPASVHVISPDSAQNLPTGVGIQAIPAYAANCWAAGFVKDGYHAYNCNNVVGAPIYTIYSDGSKTVIDHLRTNPSWFACKWTGGPLNGEGSPHPNRWLWTQGDDHGNWGWVSDAEIYNETNPITTCVF